MKAKQKCLLNSDWLVFAANEVDLKHLQVLQSDPSLQETFRDWPMITFNRERHLRDRLVKPCQHSEMINTINLLLKGYFKCGACVFIPTFLVPCIYCFCCLLDFSALYVQRTLFRPKSELHFLYFYYLSVSFSFVPLRISTLTLNKHTAGVFTITTHTITSAGALFDICAILVSMQPLYRQKCHEYDVMVGEEKYYCM